MRASYLIFTLTMLVFSHLVLGQEKQKRIDIFGGFSDLKRQDLVYSPFIHGNRALTAFGLRYSKQGNTVQFLNLDFSHNKSALTEFKEMEMDDHSHMVMPHEFVHVRFSYGFGRSFGLRGDNQLGLSFSSDVQAGFYSFQLSEMFGYFLTQSGNIWYERKLEIGKSHEFLVRFEMPILSWMSRPPYLAEDDEFIENISSHQNGKILLEFLKDGEIVSINKLQRANFQTMYRFKLTDCFNLGVSYRIDLLQTKVPKELKSFQQSLQLSLGFQF